MADWDINNVNCDQMARIFALEKQEWEQKERKGLSKYLSTKDLLKLLAVGGVISLAVVAPPLAGFVAKEIMWKERSRFNQRLTRLKNKKMVNVYYKNGEPVVEITQDGLKKALEYKFDDIKIKAPEHWDKKWRIVIFDIPNEKKKQRDYLRCKLKEIGFITLNESVLIYPYDCKDEIEFVRQVFYLDKEVTYLTSERFEGDDYYYRWFFNEE